MQNWLNNRWFLYFLIFPFFNPLCLKYIPSFTNLYSFIQFLKIISIVIIMWIYFSNRKISFIILSIALFQLVILLSSIINGVDIVKPLGNMLFYVSISMLTEISLRKQPKKFIIAFNDIMIFLTLINLIVAIVFPDGITWATLYHNKLNPLYFLSSDNGMIKNLIPLLVTANLVDNQMFPQHISKNEKKNNKRVWYANSVTLLTLFLVKSSTGILVGLLFIGLNWIWTTFLKVKLHKKIILSTYTFFFTSIVLIGGSTTLSNLIAAMFGKDGGFTGRSLLWERAIELILEHPFIGYGYTGGNISIWGKYMSSHNLMLELVIDGGIIPMLIFILITLKAINNLQKASTSYGNIIFLGIFSYLLVGLMEVGINCFYFILITLAFYPDYKISKSVKFLKF